jgi:hypothetical protein
MSVSYFQQATCAGILERFSRDLVVAPHEEGLMAIVDAAARQVDVSL